VTPVVIDASAGAEILIDTARGRALARLLPADAVGWVPEHFYAEVMAVVRRRLVIDRLITESHAAIVLDRLRRWHVRRAAVAQLIEPAWRYRHNMTAADALYVALAEAVEGHLLTADVKLVGAPTFPANVQVLRLPI
jgi:predicted nucleic acid-binding protein